MEESRESANTEKRCTARMCVCRLVARVAPRLSFTKRFNVPRVRARGKRSRLATWSLACAHALAEGIAGRAREWACVNKEMWRTTSLFRYYAARGDCGFLFFNWLSARPINVNFYVLLFYKWMPSLKHFRIYIYIYYNIKSKSYITMKPS